VARFGAERAGVEAEREKPVAGLGPVRYLAVLVAGPTPDLER
jgi:hypothetical protein